jgi:chromosome segregation ATPase
VSAAAGSALDEAMEWLSSWAKYDILRQKDHHAHVILAHIAAQDVEIERLTKDRDDWSLIASQRNLDRTLARDAANKAQKNAEEYERDWHEAGDEVMSLRAERDSFQQQLAEARVILRCAQFCACADCKRSISEYLHAMPAGKGAV